MRTEVNGWHSIIVPKAGGGIRVMTFHDAQGKQGERLDYCGQNDAMKAVQRFLDTGSARKMETEGAPAAEVEAEHRGTVVDEAVEHELTITFAE